MAHVAVIGAGRIGSAVIRQLAAAGHRVGVCDIRTEVARDLPSRAWFVSEPADAAAAADAVITALPGSPELCDLVVGQHLLEHLGPSSTWIDLTSAAPDLAAELETTADAANAEWLDAPVGGGPAAVADGTATLYVGGKLDVLNRARPLLSSFAARIVHTGRHGNGYLTKLVVNLLWFAQAVATGEALLLARRAGLDLVGLQAALAGSAADSEFLRQYVPRVLAGDYAASFGLDRVVEELESLERLAIRFDTPHEVLSLVTDLHRAALTEFGAVDGEMLAIANLERTAGLSLTEPGRAGIATSVPPAPASRTI